MVVGIIGFHHVDNDSNDIQELPSLRIRIARNGENEQLRVQDISENQINHENTENETSRLQTNHPYVNRVVGVRPTVEEEENTDEPNNAHEEEPNVRKKKCAVCDKRFVSGKKRKSKFLSCISCDRLTHEKCGDNILPFKCVHCKPVAQDVLNTSDINENVEENFDDELTTVPVVIAGHDDLNQLSLYFCVSCGETFLSNEELELHTKNHEESRYPCASCDECFGTTTDLADHVYSEHENNLDMTIPEDVEYETSNVCPLCEQSFVTYLDLQNHIEGHETVTTWTCSVCDEIFKTSEEVEEHQRNLHDDTFENSFSFLARNMGDISKVSSTINEQEVPLLESTGQNVIDDVIEHQEDQVVENSSRKRKFIDEILSVKFVGKLSKDNIISNIITKKRRKCNKW